MAFYTILQQHDNPSFLKALLKKGILNIDSDASFKLNATQLKEPLLVASLHFLSSPLMYLPKPKITKFLIDNKGYTEKVENYLTKNYGSPKAFFNNQLWQAVTRDNIDFIPMLIKLGADIDARGENNSTPLINTLQQLPVIAHTQGERVTPALQKARQLKAIKTIQMLMQNGANVTLETDDHISPISLVKADETLAENQQRIPIYIRSLILQGANPAD